MRRHHNLNKSVKSFLLIYYCIYWEFIRNLPQVVTKIKICHWTQAGAAIWDNFPQDQQGCEKLCDEIDILLLLQSYEIFVRRHRNLNKSVKSFTYLLLLHTFITRPAGHYAADAHWRKHTGSRHHEVRWLPVKRFRWPTLSPSKYITLLSVLCVNKSISSQCQEQLT